jgi:ADP-heptose:LPS heptosyltransferase
MLFPVLRSIEGAGGSFRYFTTGSMLPEIQRQYPETELRNHLGTTPSIWRRFEPSHRDAIAKFIQDAGIDLVVNLRNEDSALDSRYQRFKNSYSGPAIFHDLADVVCKSPDLRSNVLRIAATFDSLGLSRTDMQRRWLRDVVKTRARSRGPIRVGLFTGASQTVKRWRASNWVGLICWLSSLPEIEIVLYGGVSPEEHEIVSSIERDLALEGVPKDRVSTVFTSGLIDLVESLAELHLLVTNDSLPVHLAAALGLDTVGLYLSTDGSIWGGSREDLTIVQSDTALGCVMMKGSMGSCSFYYGGCPGPCAEEVVQSRVIRAVVPIIERLVSERSSGMACDRPDATQLADPVFLR